MAELLGIEAHRQIDVSSPLSLGPAAEEDLFGRRVEEPPSLCGVYIAAEDLFAMRSTAGLESYPYTQAFEDVTERLTRDLNGATSHLLRERFEAESIKAGIWRMLLYLRKNNRLKLAAGKRDCDNPIRYADVEKKVMRELLMGHSRHQCEVLPYTCAFTALAHLYRQKSPYPPRTEAEIWRLVNIIAKSRRRPRHPELFPEI